LLEEELTTGEKLYLERNRRKLTQKASAKLYDVTLAAYRAWENDQSEGPDVTLEGIETWEHYIVLRRRLGCSVPEMAAILGCNPLTLYNWESGKGSLRRLMEYWGHS